MHSYDEGGLANTVYCFHETGMDEGMRVMGERRTCQNELWVGHVWTLASGQELYAGMRAINP